MLELIYDLTDGGGLPPVSTQGMQNKKKIRNVAMA